MNSRFLNFRYTFFITCENCSRIPHFSHFYAKKFLKYICKFKKLFKVSFMSGTHQFLKKYPKCTHFSKKNLFVLTFMVVGQFYWIVLVREFDNSLVLVS